MRIHSQLRSRGIAALLLCGITTGCGFIIEPSPSPSPSPSPRDITPPRVVARFPAGGDENGMAPFSVTFSEPLDPATVTRENVRVLQPPNEVPSEVALSSDGKTITLTPSVPLALPGGVRVELGTGLMDLAGNVFQHEPVPWVFSMPVWASLGGVRPISDADGPNPHPTIALDEAGRPVVGMANLEPGFAVRFERGRWVALPSPSSTTIHASITAGLDGAIWHADASWAHSIVLNRFTGAGWTMLAPSIPISEGRITWEPRMVATRTGLTLVWTEAYFVDGTLRYEVRADDLAGGAWQGWSGSVHGLWPALATSPAGDVYTSWTSNSTVSVARLDGGFVPLPDNPSTVAQGKSSIAVGADGLPLVAFTEASGVHVKRWTGEAWVALGGSLGDAPNPGAASPVIALDSGGTPVVAFNEGASERRQLFVARWNGSGWTRLGGPLNIDPSHDVHEVALVLDARGLPIVTWAEHTGEYRNDSIGSPYAVYRMYAKRLNR
jgi:hypothetical protein